MSISDKITSIENHLTADYEGLENIGADLTNIDKNIENIRPVLDTIYSSLPKVTGENTEVTLTPTLKGKLGIVEKGNSTQESTTGKNLLKNLETTQTINGITFTPNEDGTITLNGTASANALVTLYGEWSGTTIYQALNSSKTYTISGTDNSNIQIFIRTTNGSTISSHNILNDPTFTGQTGIVNYFLQVLSGTTLNNVVIKPQLEEGSTVTSFEKYTGGIPAPNPSYPFPIKSVTGNNNVVVNSANLLSQSNLEWGNISTTTGENGGGNGAFIRTKTFIKVSGGSKYSGNYTKSTGSKQFILYKYDSSKNYLGYDIYDSANSFTKTLENNVNYIRLRLLSAGSTETEVLNNISDVIFNNGEVIPYVPYQNQTLPLNLGNIELNGRDVFVDLMFKNIPSSPYYNNTLTEGNWYKYEIIKKIVLNGSEEWSLFFNTTGLYRYTPDPISREIDTSINCLCNYYQGTTRANIRNNLGTVDNVCATFKNELIIANKSITSINDFKTWLGTHNTVVDYILNTPTYTEITDTNLINQLENIDKMKSYNGTTIITSTFDSNNAQMIISASGLKGE